MNVCIIIPALNEEKALPSVLNDLNVVSKQHFSALDRFQIVVADSGSTDHTAQTARTHGAQVVIAPQRGYGAACQAGLSVVGKEVDIVVFMDGDYSDFAQDLPALLGPIRENRADFVLGERVTLGHAALTPAQRFGNSLACFLMRVLYGFTFKDLGPFRAIRRSAIESLSMRDQAFGWTIEMQIKAIKQKLRIQEVPVRCRSRIGKSKISGTLTGSVRAGWGILTTIVRYAR